MKLFARLFVLAAAANFCGAAELRTLDARQYHLRSGTNAEWEEFAASQPQGRRLEVSFSAHSNATEQTLFIWQDDVKQDWRVGLNGKLLGSLFAMEAPSNFALPLPPGVLKEGSNNLSIQPPRENDDIRVGNIRLAPQPLEHALDECAVEVEVTDADSGKPSPCRITISETNESLAAIFVATNQFTAARPGVVYTADGHALIQLLAGNYNFTATRGFEFSLDSTNIMLTRGDRRTIRLQLRREVQTSGLVSCDTHVHTFTYSRHGDATVVERTVTLAGEGIELPIATDHDIATDFQPAANATHARDYFTPIIGDEVTTRVGHFNIFPVNASAKLPSNLETNWTTLIDSFRATRGVQVVVFNHPRNTHSGFQPFARTNFNSLTGEARWPFDFRVDAIELINSSAMQSDYMSVFRDWFALWNAGHQIVGVGSSDGHDVSRYIVGQGRTYIECDDKNSAALDVNSACRNLKAGRAYVSLGLLPIITVNEKFHPGDLVTTCNCDGETVVKVEVRAPSWIRCDHVELFANGTSICATNFSAEQTRPSRGIAVEVEWKIPVPEHDTFLVAIASGPGNTEPHWALAKPYQPNSPRWTPRVIGATNPVRIDADGDKKFSSAHDYAVRLVKEAGANTTHLIETLENFEEAVAIQAAAIARHNGANITSKEFQRALAGHESVQRAFAKVIEEERAK